MSASKCAPPKPTPVLANASKTKKSSSKEEDGWVEKETATPGVKEAPFMVAQIGSKKMDSTSGDAIINDGKIVNPIVKAAATSVKIAASKKEESSSDDNTSSEEDNEKPDVKEVQVVDLENSSGSDDDSIVEEKKDTKKVLTVVLESSSDSNSSDDEEETAETVGASEPSVSSKEETDNNSPVVATDRKVDRSASTSKGEELPMDIGKNTNQEAAAGCRLFVRGVAQVSSLA